jgi:hypothetical protein
MRNRTVSAASEPNESTTEAIELTGARWAFKHAAAAWRRRAVERLPQIYEKLLTHAHPSRPGSDWSPWRPRSASRHACSGAGCAALAHAIIPRLFETTASRMIRRRHCRSDLPRERFSPVAHRDQPAAVGKGRSSGSSRHADRQPEMAPAEFNYLLVLAERQGLSPCLERSP